jgi:ABC-type antimicrobial peptide transport system ATPase subunit
LLADRLGDGRERDAVNTLLRGDIENRMHPTMQHLQNFALVTRNGASCGAISPLIRMRIGTRLGAFCPSAAAATPPALREVKQPGWAEPIRGR